MKPPSEQIDTGKLVRQPPDGVIRHLKLRAAAGKLVKRVHQVLVDDRRRNPRGKASVKDVSRQYMLEGAMLEVQKCLDQ